MQANKKQVAGDHYIKLDYQHWDFVCDIKLPYLLGCATKYVCRWKDKNGVQDLGKTVHYLEKAGEKSVYWENISLAGWNNICSFLNQLPAAEADIILRILLGDYFNAIIMINSLIADTQVESSEAEDEQFQKEISLARSRDGV